MTSEAREQRWAQLPTETFDVEPPYSPDDEDLPADRFADRELSWLHFNTRVLELAEDETLPLLERVRFLAIVASNFDEFFMVRVAGLKRRIAAGVAVRAASGLLPREVLAQILSTTDALMSRHAALFGDQLVPALADDGIELLRCSGSSSRPPPDRAAVRGPRAAHRRRGDR